MCSNWLDNQWRCKTAEWLEEAEGRNYHPLEECCLSHGEPLGCTSLFESGFHLRTIWNNHWSQTRSIAEDTDDRCMSGPWPPVARIVYNSPAKPVSLRRHPRKVSWFLGYLKVEEEGFGLTESVGNRKCWEERSYYLLNRIQNTS